MKSTEFINEGTSLHSYNKSIIDTLKGLDYKVDSREGSAAGLYKTWFVTTNPMSIEFLASMLSATYPGTKVDNVNPETQPDEINGPGFKIELQGPRELFLAVFGGAKGSDYAMGLDEDGIDNGTADMQDSTKRRARLKAEIEAGMMPTVHNITATVDPVYTCGDLQALDWMDIEYTYDNEGDVEGWTRHYHGPKPVKIATRGAKSLQLLKPGEILD